MDLATRLAELQKRTQQHREVLLTEEAAKNALVMPSYRRSATTSSTLVKSFPSLRPT
jgi:hypothetical protein